jgi:hypothetical protein
MPPLTFYEEPYNANSIRICFNCIGEDFLRDEVRAKRDEGLCFYLPEDDL